MANGFTYGGQTILSEPIFVETILPFILIFTVVFAFLQKAKVFGENKKQIDAIVGLVVALLVISFAQATGIIVQLMPFLAVSLVVILVFMILMGSYMGDKIPGKKVSTILTVLVSIAVIVAVLIFTDAWSYLADLFNANTGSPLFVNILFIVIIAGAIIAVVTSVGKKKDG